MSRKKLESSGTEIAENFYLQVTADLTPLNTRKVAVKFDFFKIAGLVSLSNQNLQF